MHGLYVHIPFCKTKCIYCDFYSLPHQKRYEQVTQGLIEEFEARRDEIGSSFDTVYFGGGTPSQLPDPLLASLAQHFNISRAKEATIEVNPDDITPQKALLLKQIGFNRVSIGVQSLNDDILRFMRRRHTAAQAVQALKWLAEAGFDNISADFIYGVPGLSDDLWSDTLNQAKSLPISHLSCYCLTAHEGTALQTLIDSGKVEMPSDETCLRHFEILREFAAREGFDHYEISNLALPGRRSLHNSAYWHPKSRWLGIGPSAHSFDGSTRRIDHPDIKTWLTALPRPFEIDPENDIDRLNDTIITALRTEHGLPLAWIPAEFHPQILEAAGPFISAGKIKLNNDRLSIPEQHWFVSDGIIAQLLLL